jgi:PAS domain S-box-containing protein
MKNASDQKSISIPSINDANKSKRSLLASSKIFNKEKEGLSALVDSIQEEVWFVDADKRLIFVNRAVLEEFGPEFQIGRYFEEVAAELLICHLDGTARPLEDAPLLRALGGEIIRIQEELAYIPSKGELRHRQVSAAPVRTKDGRIIGSVSLIRDVTDLKKTEKKLRESEQRYRALAGSSPDAIIVHRQNEFLYANPAALILYGADNFDQLKRRKVFDFLAPDYADQPFDIFEHMEQSLPLPSKVARLIRLDGQEVFIETHADYIIYGKSRAVQVILRDITERIRTEAALREANATLERKIEERTAELAQRASQLRALAGELTLAEQRERKRLASIMHDHIQQLLVAAKFRTTALSGNLRDEERLAIEEIQELIDECISSARSLTAELSPPILHEGGLNAGLDWLAKRVAVQQGLNVSMQMDEVCPLPEDLKVALFEAIRELLFNVVKHAHTQSASVMLQCVDSLLKVTVSDQGIGFDPNALPSVIASGGGFGLFGIRERLELFGGTLEMDSAPGCGSRIVLSVPIKEPVEPPFTQLLFLSGHSDPVRMPPSSPKKKIRILLADDHKIVRQGISNLICSHPDLEIIGEAGDGQETVELAVKLAPDLILMDVSMPKISGIEATRIIHREFPEMRIIGLSMYEEAERAQTMRAAGAVDYLTKSGPAEELIKAIHAAFPATFFASGQIAT